MSRLPVPDRELRPATLAACPECRTLVPTRDGRLAGHYSIGTTLCSASSTPIPADLRSTS